MYELVWGPPGGTEEPREERATVGSPEELRERLDALQRVGRDADPFVALLVHPSNGRLGIGLGGELSFATFERSDGQPPYYVSGGGAAATEPLVFFLEGEWTELPPEAAIPVSEAVEAMVAFLREGSRPENVDWIET